MDDIPNLCFMGGWSFSCRSEVIDLQVVSSIKPQLLGPSKDEVEASLHKISSRDPEKGLCYPELNFGNS